MANLAIVVSVALSLAPITTTGISSGITNFADVEKATKTVIESPLAAIQRNGGILIAQQYHGWDPHGDDPHGSDPSDEVHDPGLPANAQRGVGRATKNVYGSQIPNSQNAQDGAFDD